MRLTALCICGTLLAFSSLSWTLADSDEGDILGDNAFRPCAATLRPEGLCRQGQDESTCPYLFSLPPLTLHLPKQLIELEKIVTDLQKLKDNVDQLRKMCADCTVSQTERECGRQRERGHEKRNEGTDRHKDERNWLNERNPKRPKDFSQEGGTDSVKAEKTMEGDVDTDSEKRTILEEKGRKKWEAERERDKVVVKENQREETLKVAEKDGKTKTEGAKQKDKLEQAKVPTAGGNEKIVDVVRKKVVEKNNNETETDRKKDNNGKGNSKGDPDDTLENGKKRKITSNVKNKEKTEESDHHVWQDETKETEKNTQTEEDRGSDGIKMSEGHDEHTNQEREQHREERKKEMEKGIKVERNNEKPKQTESIGHAEKEKTIKEGEVEDGETGTEIKTGEKMVQSVQRDSDGELASSKATERTDFVSISPTAQSIISLAPRQDTLHSNEVITFTSSLPSPFLSSSTLHLITDVNQGMTIVADGLPTQSTGFGAAVISEYPSPDAEEDFRATSSPTTTATINTLGGPGQQITSATSRFTSTTSARPDADFQGRVSSTTATTTTTTPRQNLYITTSPGVADRSRWTAKKNISSNTKTGMKPLPGREPKPSEKHKPAIKPEADQRLKNPRNDRKPVRAPLPDKKTKLDQKSKPGKDPKRVQIPTPEQRPLPSHLPTDQNLKNNQIPKHDQEHTAHQSQLPIQKPTTQKPQTANPTGSDKDLQTGREPESVEIPITSQNSKLEKKLVHPLKYDKPDQPQKTHKELKSEEKTKSDQRSTINQYFPPVQKPEPEKSETTSLPPTPNQKPITELMKYADENPLSVNDSTPEQNLTPGRPLINPPDQKPKPSQKIPKINQKPKPNQKHPDLTTGQKTKPHVKPKPDQIAQTNQGFITPQPDQMPDFNPKSAPDKIPEEKSNKTSKPRPPPIRRPPTRPTVRPGATPVERPKPAVQQKPSPKTKADLDPLQISGTKSEDIQNSQTDMPPVSSPGTQIAEVSHSPGDTEFSPRTERSETTSLPPTPNQKPITELMKYADENPLSVNDSTPEQKLTPGRPLINPPDQKPKPSQKIPKINQKPKPNQKHPDLTTGQKTKPHVKPKPDQIAQTNQGFITPQPDQMPDFNPKSAPDKIPEEKSNKTSKPRPPPIRRPPTRPTVRPTVRPGATPVERPKPAVQQKPSPKTKADLDPLQISGTKSEDIQNSQTDMPPVSSPGTQIAEVSHSPGDTEFSPRTERSETTSLPPTPNQKPITELMKYADENPLSVNDSTPEQKLTPGRPLINPPDQKPKPSQKIPKINQKPKPNQKHPDLTTGQKTKPHVKPKPDQIAQTNQGFITPQPDQMPDFNPKSAPDKIPEEKSNKTSKPRPPPIRRPPTRPTVRPGATPVQMPKPAMQQKPSLKTKADLDPLQTSGTKSEDIQNSQTDMPPALSPGTQIAEVSHSPGDTEFSPITMQTITLGPKTSNSLETGPFPRLHTLSEGFTMSRNSRITSDLRPQTTSRPPSIPMTTSPQKNIRGILPSVIPSTSPGSDSRSQAKILHNVEETAPRQTPDPDKMMIPVPTPSAQTTSTNSPDLRSTTPATSGPEPLAAESSTPSARELRVKINQVAAFFNNSLSPNQRPPDRRTKEHPEDNQGGSRPDSKLITSKVNTASDCSNHRLRGETKSGVYLVTPDLRSKSFPVFCDMELAGGGWTLLQRRQDGSVNFNRTWAEYRSGFGELDGGEFWLGNNMIHLLTRDRDMVLRVELEDFNGVMEYAEYEQFRVASERMRYRLTVGGYSGTAGDALRFSRSYDHNNRAFTTPDRDHDRYPTGNCGAYYSSGWWFDACMAANLNGRYYVGSYRGVRDGIFWGTWQNISNEYYPTNDRQSFKTVTMMIRPKGFTP